MPRTNPTDRIRKIEERKQALAERERQLTQELRRLRSMEADEERKRDTRRKIIVGSVILGLVDRGEWPKARLLDYLEKHLTRDHDRALFGLSLHQHSGAPEGGVKDTDPIEGPSVDRLNPGTPLPVDSEGIASVSTPTDSAAELR